MRERARFQGPLAEEGGRPRELALDSEIAQLSVAEVLLLGRVNHFEEAPASALKQPGWRVVAARKWRRSARIHRLEAGARCWAIRRLGRNLRMHH